MNELVAEESTETSNVLKQSITKGRLWTVLVANMTFFCVLILGSDEGVIEQKGSKLILKLHCRALL